MKVLILLNFLVCCSLTEASRRGRGGHELSRFRKAKSKSRLMALDELKKYEMTLTPVEKALHRNLLHLIESEAEAQSEGSIKMTEEADVHRRQPNYRNDNSRRKDGRGTKGMKEQDYSKIHCVLPCIE